MADFGGTNSDVGEDHSHGEQQDPRLSVDDVRGREAHPGSREEEEQDHGCPRSHGLRKRQPSLLGLLISLGTAGELSHFLYIYLSAKGVQYVNTKTSYSARMSPENTHNLMEFPMEVSIIGVIL